MFIEVYGFQHAIEALFVRKFNFWRLRAGAREFWIVLTYQQVALHLLSVNLLVATVLSFSRNPSILPKRNIFFRPGGLDSRGVKCFKNLISLSFLLVLKHDS